MIVFTPLFCLRAALRRRFILDGQFLRRWSDYRLPFYATGKSRGKRAGCDAYRKCHKSDESVLHQTALVAHVTSLTVDKSVRTPSSKAAQARTMCSNPCAGNCRKQFHLRRPILREQVFSCTEVSFPSHPSFRSNTYRKDAFKVMLFLTLMAPYWTQGVYTAQQWSTDTATVY